MLRSARRHQVSQAGQPSRPTKGGHPQGDVSGRSSLTLKHADATGRLVLLHCPLSDLQQAVGDHPNVVRIIKRASWDDTFWICMEVRADSPAVSRR